MKTDRSDELLSTETVGEYLRDRGLIESDERVQAAELAGGVANIVIAVSSGSFKAVVKQALPKFRVKENWEVKRERSATEARALQLAAELAPGSVPGVLDIDTTRSVIVIEQAPENWRNYKQMLLAGDADVGVATTCGRILGTWHRRTWDQKRIESQFNDLEAFDQQRIDPYYRTAAARNPSVKPLISRYAETMAANRHVLVHGDFSPKNILSYQKSVWILDWEVAHFGDAAFDLAFMLNHLMLKSIHRPQIGGGYKACAEAFWDAYRLEIEHEKLPLTHYLFGHVGCLMLARVDGKSPVEYLIQPEKEVARKVSLGMLGRPPESIREAWERTKA